ncbi:hypothetical protein J2Z50_006096 [Ensifer mexicanus]|nr:hypothetical protein [Sinorhizobium mexicanum]
MNGVLLHDSGSQRRGLLALCSAIFVARETLCVAGALFETGR